jgi:hypothetical protein
MEPKIRVDCRRRRRYVHRALSKFGPHGVGAPAGLSFCPHACLGYCETVAARFWCATLANFVCASVPAVGFFLPLVGSKALIAKQIDLTLR